MNNFNDEGAGKAEENVQRIRNYLNANQLQDLATASPTGLHSIITPANSTAKQTKMGEELEFTYTLSYINSMGQLILLDSTNKSKPAYLPFLPGIVILGLEEGLSMLKEGQKGRFFIPSNIAFGSDNRQGKMEPYSPAVFDVEMKRSRTELQQMDDYASIKKLGKPTLTESAISNDTANVVRIYKLSSGTGPAISLGQTVTVAYIANTFRGSQPFDKGDSLSFRIGSRQVIDGFDMGIRKLNVGDKAILVFPSTLGYGTQGSFDQAKREYIVPPYTPLSFEVTVKSAK
ncbi:FKBP-type peptidyl-prolyl cis-trans isomerase [Larkinella harenae]